MKKVAVTLPFGKYKGWDINNVPRHYLAWVVRECGQVPSSLTTEIKKLLGAPIIIEQRIEQRVVRQVVAPRPESGSLGNHWADHVEQWYAGLAEDFPEHLQALTEARRRIVNMLSEGR